LRYLRANAPGKKSALTLRAKKVGFMELNEVGTEAAAVNSWQATIVLGVITVTLGL